MPLFRRGPRLPQPSTTDLNPDWYRLKYSLARVQVRAGKEEADQTISDILEAANRTLAGRKTNLRLRKFLTEVVVPSTDVLAAERAVVEDGGAAAAVQAIIDRHTVSRPQAGLAVELARYLAMRHAAGLTMPDGSSAAEAAIGFLRQPLASYVQLSGFYAAKLASDPVFQQLARDPDVGAELVELVPKLNPAAGSQQQAEQPAPTDKGAKRSDIRSDQPGAGPSKRKSPAPKTSEPKRSAPKPTERNASDPKPEGPEIVPTGGFPGL